MGQALHTKRLTGSRRDELALAATAQAIVDRLGPLHDPSSDELSNAEGAVLAALRGAGDLARDGQAEGEPAPAGLLVPLPLVGLDGLEVTQAVQDLGHSVPLVAGKATVVRAYLRFPSAPVKVRGELLVARSPVGPWRSVPSLGVASLDPSRSGGGLANLRTRRADLGWSLNFLVPQQVAGAGVLFLRLGTIQRSTGGPLPSLAGLSVRSFTIQPAATLRLRLIKLRYSQGTPPVAHQPSATDENLIRSWLGRAYPIAALDMTSVTVNATPTPPFGANLVNAQLAALRAVDISTGTDARTHYYGLVSDGGFFMRGLAAGIPGVANPGTVASGPTGSATFGWDNDGSYGDWYTGHELGHTLGRFHVEFCGAAGGAPYPFPDGQLSAADEAFVGIDVGDASLGLPLRVMGGISSHDVMSYCSNQWLSSFTYKGVYDRLLAEEGLAAGAAPGARDRRLVAEPGGEPASVQVVAAVNLSERSGTITSVLPVALDVTPPDRAAGREPLALVFRDVAGGALEERPVPFLPSACLDPGDDVIGLVDAIVAPVPGAAAVDLVLDGQVLDSYTVGGQARDIGDLAVTGVSVTGVSGPAADAVAGVELRWDASEAPAHQRYIVQVSTDAGGTWQTVAAGLDDPAVTLDPADFPAVEVTVRVLATTGFETTTVRTETVVL